MVFRYVLSLLAGAAAIAFVGRPTSAAGASSAVDIMARVRASGVLHCASIVRPGIAVPTVDGERWFGVDVDLCEAIAAAVLGSSARITMRPYFGAGTVAAATAQQTPQMDDVVFLGGSDLLGPASDPASSLIIGPAVVHDAFGLLVPANGVHHIEELGNRTICVEPGSPSERALMTAFAKRAIALHEHPFQETDEMRQAYGDGRCDALAGPVTTLANVRADPTEGHPADRILPELLTDDPIFAATSGDAHWSRVVWWVFSALIGSDDRAPLGTEESGIVSGIPPIVATDLQLPKTWIREAVAARGNYETIFARNLGAQSRLHLAAQQDSLYGLFVR